MSKMGVVKRVIVLLYLVYLVSSIHARFFQKKSASMELADASLAPLAFSNKTASNVSFPERNHMFSTRYVLIWPKGRSVVCGKAAGGSHLNSLPENEEMRCRHLEPMVKSGSFIFRFFFFFREEE